ncbi:MAG: TldD/PmbA family protein [Candidatus Odinarchaeota archaeon]
MSEAAQINRILSKNTVEDWELYIQKIIEAEVHRRESEFESLRYPLESSGYGIRVLKKKVTGVGLGAASGNLLTDKHIEETVKIALKNASITSLPAYRFPEPQKYSKTAIIDNEIIKDPLNTLLDKAEQLTSILSNYSKVNLTFCKLRAYQIHTSIYNSNGLQARKKETFFYLELALKAEENGKIAEYWPNKYYRRISDFNLETSIEDWVKLTEDSLHAKTPPTGKMDVIFPPDILAELLPPVIGYHASGQALYKNLSSFKQEHLIASENITIIDNGLHPYALNTSPFDDEGNPQRKTIIIDKGVFKNYIFDQLYALLTSKNPTGNGLRIGSTIEQKYNAQISNTVTNIEIKPGDWEINDIISNVKKGILIRKFAWLNPDPINTSFGSEIRNGYLIVNGKVAGVVKGGQISGQVLDATPGTASISLLKNIFALSKQQKLEGNILAPTIAAHNLQITGRSD